MICTKCQQFASVWERIDPLIYLCPRCSLAWRILQIRTLREFLEGPPLSPSPNPWPREDGNRTHERSPKHETRPQAQPHDPRPD